MTSLFDCIKYNNIPYAELENDRYKRKVELLVRKLEEKGLDKDILASSPHEGKNFDIRHMDGEILHFVTNIPKALSNKMSIICHDLNF